MELAKEQLQSSRNEVDVMPLQLGEVDAFRGRIVNVLELLDSHSIPRQAVDPLLGHSPLLHLRKALLDDERHEDVITLHENWQRHTKHHRFHWDHKNNLISLDAILG